MDCDTKEKGRTLFESVIRNTDFLGDFEGALKILEKDEYPYMWLLPHIAGLPEARVMVTNRRLAVFRVRLLRAKRLALVAVQDLDALSSVSVRQSGDASEGKASLVLSFGPPTPDTVDLGGLHLLLAEEAKKFLALPAQKRASAAKQLREVATSNAKHEHCPECGERAVSAASGKPFCPKCGWHAASKSQLRGGPSRGARTLQAPGSQDRKASDQLSGGRTLATLGSALRVLAALMALFGLVMAIATGASGGGVGGLLPALLLVVVSFSMFRVGGATRNWGMSGQTGLRFYIPVLFNLAVVLGLAVLLLSVAWQ
jgi:hypothetical protein